MTLKIRKFHVSNMDIQIIKYLKMLENISGNNTKINFITENYIIQILEIPVTVYFEKKIIYLWSIRLVVVDNVISC
jgi:hypothetical protein